MLVIKKDAVITAKIGVGFISELQKTFLHLSDRKKEDIDKILMMEKIFKLSKLI
jgi:hypothetical protein